MTRFEFWTAVCLGIYLAELVVFTGPRAWLFLSWGRRTFPYRGPVLRFRNPWPMGWALKALPPPASPLPSSALSVEAARGRWETLRMETQGLDWDSRGILLFAVSAFLLFLSRRGSALAWGLWAAGFLFFHLAAVLGFWRGWGKLHPGDKRGRWKGTLMCLLSPWQSSRASDLLAEGVLEDFHPLTLGKILLEEGPFRAFARKWLLELHYPDEKMTAPAPLYLSGDGKKEAGVLMDWLRGQGLDPEGLLKPPEPSHPSHLSFCRRCDIEYGIAEGNCSDCGRELVPYSAKGKSVPSRLDPGGSGKP